MTTLPQLRRLGALASISLAGIGCSGEELEQRDLGNTGASFTADGAAPPSDRTPIVDAEGRIDPFAAGHWVGHAEDLFAPAGPGRARPTYAFPSGSSDFTLDINVEDPTTPMGGIAFGSGSAPPPEPGVVYPPGFPADAALASLTREVQLPPVEGFVYQLRENVGRKVGGGVAAGALELSYQPNLAYTNWCKAQPPHPSGDGSFDCATPSDPDDPSALCSSLNPDGSLRERFDCDLLSLCMADNVCHCTRSQCNVVEGIEISIWLIRDGEDLLGTFTGAVFDYGTPARYLPVGTVRFERVSP